MARAKMVTRTVTTTVAEVMCLHVETAEVSVNTYRVSGEVADHADLLKRIKKQEETDVFKCVAVTSAHYETALYGMTEEDFLTYAKVLPPRTVATADENE